MINFSDYNQRELLAMYDVLGEVFNICLNAKDAYEIARKVNTIRFLVFDEFGVKAEIETKTETKKEN